MADDTAPVAPMEVKPKAEVSDVKILPEDSENGGAKRSREEDEAADKKEEKRTKTEDEKSGEAMAEEEKESGDAVVGPKTFATSVAMFDYFYKLLHSWTPNLNVNKYEHLVLLELLKKGHVEAERKIGSGVKAFQVRFHPQFKSRCFFLIREDESADDFSFRKCVDHISPLPENMQVKNDVNKALRGKGGGRGRGRGRGRGWK